VTKSINDVRVEELQKEIDFLRERCAELEAKLRNIHAGRSEDDDGNSNDSLDRPA
jgi:hypothetical protein